MSRANTTASDEAPADAFESHVSKLADYENSDLDDRTKMAIRVAEAVTTAPEIVDEDFMAKAREHFSDDQILDLGMISAFLSGWQRFIEAFKIVPDRWTEGDPAPWKAYTEDTDQPAQAAQAAQAAEES